LVDMVDKLTAKVEMMGREMLQRDEKVLVTTPSASYAGAASVNAGLGGRVRFVSSKEPVALEPVALAREQDVLERRMNVIVRGVEEIDVEWKAEGYIKKAYDMEQVAFIAHAKAPEYTLKDYKEAICCRGSSSPRNKSTSWNEVFSILTVYWYWRLQSIIAKDLSSSLFQSCLLEESTSNLSILCSSPAPLLLLHLVLVSLV
jgi:hypothetical protein